MLVTCGNGLILTSMTSLLFRKKSPKFSVPSCKKREESKSKNPSTLKLRVSSPILARAAVAVLGLGFVDAGYSGDWSRIGVISKETEALLKIAAFLVLPFCIFLILSFTKDTEA